MVPDPAKMQAVVDGAKTVSDKVRALDRAGYRRADIARFLGKRYQQVRNVLVGDQQAKRSETADVPPDRSSHSDSDNPQGPRSTKVRVGPEGQINIPAPFREALGIREGDVLFARIEDGELHILTATAAMRRAQAIVRQFVPEGVSLVDELIEDRRREAAREAERG